MLYIKEMSFGQSNKKSLTLFFNLIYLIVKVRRTVLQNGASHHIAADTTHLTQVGLGADKHVRDILT